MKRLLTTLVIVAGLFFTPLLTGCDQTPVEVKFSDLVYTADLFYKKFSSQPFTGRVGGQVQGALKKGKWDGHYAEFWDNGRLFKKGTYKSDKWEGPWVYYHDNGKLMSKGTFKDGKRERPWIYYSRNGQLLSKGTYKDGKEEGPWVYFKEDGTKDMEYSGTYRNGEKVSD